MIIPDTISRIQLSKISICLIKELYYLKLKIFLSSEFSEPTKGLLFQSLFEVSLLPESNKDVCLCQSSAWLVLPTTFTFSSSSNSYALLARLAPSVDVGISPGYYYIQIKSKPQLINDKRVLILPIITTKMFLEESSSLVFPFITSNYRIIHLFPTSLLPVVSVMPTRAHNSANHNDDNDDGVLENESLRHRLCISEQYGKTIGHHVYDCAIVLLYYLRHHFEEEKKKKQIILMMECLNDVGKIVISNDYDMHSLFDKPRQLNVSPLSPHSHPRLNHSSHHQRICVELGAGIGVVGIGLSPYFDYMFVTDKISQMSVLQENIQLNHNNNNNQPQHPNQHHQQEEEETRSSITPAPLDWDNETDIDNFLLLISDVTRHHTKLSHDFDEQTSHEINNVAVRKVDSCDDDDDDDDDGGGNDIVDSSSSAQLEEKVMETSASMPSSSSSLPSPLPVPVVIDVIVASDVLYDADAAKLFFHTLRRLATPSITQIFLTQKLRESSSSSSSNTVNPAVMASNTVDCMNLSTDSAADQCNRKPEGTINVKQNKDKDNHNDDDDDDDNDDVICAVDILATGTSTIVSTSCSASGSSSSKTARFDVASVPGFQSRKLHQAANCVVWGLTLL